MSQNAIRGKRELYGRSEYGTGNRGGIHQPVNDGIDDRDENGCTHVKVRRHRTEETGRGGQEARGWGLTQKDIASFVGWSQSLISLGFSSFYAFRRHAIKNGVEQGHGTQPNRLGMKDLWPSATRSGLTAISLF